MNHDTIIQAWIAHCKKVVDALDDDQEWTVTRAEQTTGTDAPRPPKPYLTLKIISGPRQITLDDERRANGNDVDDNPYSLVGQRGYTLSIKSFGTGYLDALHEISMALDDPDYGELLKTAADIAVTNRGNATDISAVLETGFERRANIDISFNTTHNREMQIGVIEHAEISGVINEDEPNEKEIGPFEVNKE